MKETRIGIIGSGNIVGRHIDALQSIPDVRISGYYSPSQPDRPANWGRKLPDVDAVMAESDAIFVCVPPNQHGVEIKLAQAGKPFFVEKPLATDREFPQKVSRLVAAKDLPTAVGYQWRASPISQEAKNHLQHADVSFVTARYLDPALSYVPEWFLNREISGGPLVEQATHVLDEARYLLGEFSVLSAQESFAIPDAFLRNRPELQQATIPTEIAADIRFASGIPGRFESSAVQQGERRVELEVSCADGSTLTIARDRIVRDSEVVFELLDFTSVSTVEQDQAFTNAVRTGNQTVVYASYADALRTHNLVMDINDKAREHAAAA